MQELVKVTGSILIILGAILVIFALFQFKGSETDIVPVSLMLCGFAGMMFGGLGWLLARSA